MKASKIRITYRRVPHAAHVGPKDGWDLEVWDVRQPYSDDRPSPVPEDAKKHSGYVGDDG
jgi:hypothetical protein